MEAQVSEERRCYTLLALKDSGNGFKLEKAGGL
jgi:hypothetical protein